MCVSHRSVWFDLGRPWSHFLERVTVISHSLELLLLQQEAQQSSPPLCFPLSFLFPVCVGGRSGRQRCTCSVQLKTVYTPPLSLVVLQETAASCDAELLSSLLKAGLLVGCVSSALYPWLSSHLLSHQQEGGWDVERAAAELLAAGHGPEAGSLLLAHRGTHPAQFTFNSALAVLKKWL